MFENTFFVSMSVQNLTSDVLTSVGESDCCASLSQSISRVWSSLIPARSISETASEKFGVEVSRINSPGQRFTATHGISASTGETKVFVYVRTKHNIFISMLFALIYNITVFISYFRFDVDRNDVNYIAVSSNIALEGSNGGPEKYELYMKYGAVPTPIDYDLKSSLTASDSYVGTVLYRYCFEKLRISSIMVKPNK